MKRRLVLLLDRRGVADGGSIVWYEQSFGIAQQSPAQELEQIKRFPRIESQRVPRGQCARRRLSDHRLTIGYHAKKDTRVVSVEIAEARRPRPRSGFASRGLRITAAPFGLSVASRLRRLASPQTRASLTRCSCPEDLIRLLASGGARAYR